MPNSLQDFYQFGCLVFNKDEVKQICIDGNIGVREVSEREIVQFMLLMPIQRALGLSLGQLKTDKRTMK
ncbi:MAG: hypothetical protein HOP07_18850 [Bacteriovoracaceae bacterium]|nr:hypothetical protein [Bacteriovoracaceae bacterium]